MHTYTQIPHTHHTTHKHAHTCVPMFIHDLDALGPSHLVADCSKMSDSERDQIDLEAKEFIRLCSEKIRSLQEECEPGAVM